MDALVPTCEDWTMADLASHLGSFCGFWSHVLCEATGRTKTPYTDPPEGDDLVGWFTQLGDHLVELLRAIPASTPVWTWLASDQSAGFVARRCAHELAVHRTDAQAARGEHLPIPADLAVDGIDEIFDALLAVRERPGPGTGRTLALRSADRPSAWLLTLGAERIGVERPDPGEARLMSSNLVVTASSSDLELTLYHRPALSPVEMAGDYTVLDEWYRDFRF